MVGATTVAPTTSCSDSPPPETRALAVAALLTAASSVLAGWYVFSIAAEQASAAGSWIQILCLLAATAMPVILLPPIVALRDSRRAKRLWGRGEVSASRQVASESRGRSLGTFGYVGAVIPLLVVVAMLVANDGAVRSVFFSWEMAQKTIGGILQALLLNVQIAISAMTIVLAVGLVVAIGRLLPGRSFRPIRLLAIGWVDIFRAIPAIILIYLIGFGLPLTGLPVISSMSPVMYAILALSLTYSAYVAETYRAGIESIHPSQVAAGRSLGLSSFKTMRLVVLPQAIRRIVPSLLTFFVGMQKDTALVGVLGLVDAFAQSRIYSANYFNLTPVMVVCGLFIILTIPQTRFVDALLSRDQRKRGQ